MECDIERLTFSVRTYREYLELEGKLGMGRLTDISRAAAAVGPRLAAKFEARATAIIEREAGLSQKGDAAFGEHEALLDEASTALDDVEAALHILSNGGPPLEPSATLPVSPQPGPVASTEPIANGDAPQKDVFHV